METIRCPVDESININLLLNYSQDYCESCCGVNLNKL